MAADENSTVEENGNFPGFMSALSSAACEWFLIFLLLIDAVLSYLLTKFADYCKLQTPCILCSRIDHIIGSEKPGVYRDLLCSNHISEISSLICGHAHGKLADVHAICDDCIFSFTRKNVSYSEMQRILGGILGMDIGRSGMESLLLSRDFVPVSGGTAPCSCCGKPWRPRQHAQRISRPKLYGSMVPKPDTPLPHLPSHGHLHHRNSFKKIRNKFHVSIASHGAGKSGFDPLSHAGYTKLKINSDSESEVPFSDEDDNRSRATDAIHEKSRSTDDFSVQNLSENQSKEPSNDFISENVTNCWHESRSLLSDLRVQPDVNKDHHEKTLACDNANANFVGELGWQEVHQNPDLYMLPELISLDEIPESSTVLAVPHEDSVKNKLKFPLQQDVNSSGQFDLITSDETLSFVRASSVKYVSGTRDVGLDYVENHKKLLKLPSLPSATSVKVDQVDNYPASVKPSHLGANDLCEVAGSYLEGKSSDFVSEVPIPREPDTLDEETRHLSLSKDPLDQGSNSSSKNRILGEYDHGDEVQVTSSSSGTQMLRKSASVESSLESLDVQNVSDIEGESIVDRLKRQVDYDRKCINSLYKELEEERNASAVAANQAMAMITRLQEEKAALHMEALQYLRMMEEQAEYDVDALERANDLLAEKEKEMQDMEAELELYKLNLPDETVTEDFREGTFELNITSKKVKSDVLPSQDNTRPPKSDVLPSQDNTSLPLKLMTDEVSGNGKEPFAAEIPQLEFEDEKLYISQCLRNLEMKLHQISCNGAFSNIPHGGNSKIFADDRLKGEESPTNDDIQLNGQVEEYDYSSMKGELHLCNGSTATLDDATASNGDDSSLRKATEHCDCNGRKDSASQREVSLVALENEILDLNDRLEALEADHDFLEHMLNSLQNGNNGLQFIHEIAHQLQELGKLGIRLRKQSPP